MVKITKIRNVATIAGSASGSDVWKINQAKADVVAVEIQAVLAGATAWASHTDVLYALFQRLTVQGDSEVLIDSNRGIWHRMLHFLTTKYISGLGRMPYESLDGSTFDATYRLLFPIMVKKNQFRELTVNVTYGDLAISTGAESVAAPTVRVLYGQVDKNWYIRPDTKSISSANSAEELRFLLTIGLPLSLSLFAWQDAGGLQTSAAGANPAVTYGGDFFDQFSFEKDGEFFYTQLNANTMEELTENVLGINYNENIVDPNLGDFLVVDGKDADAATTVVELQQYVYAVDGFDIQPTTETFFTVRLDGSSVDSGDFIHALHIYTAYPKGVGQPIAESKDK